MAARASRLTAPVAAFRLPAPALAGFAAGLTLAGIDGGYPPAVWYVGALFMLSLLAITAMIAPPRPEERSRLFDAALMGYAAFCLWNYLSIAWADVPADAWDGANRTLLYGIVLALVGLRPWTRSAGRMALALVAVGTAAMAAGVLVVSVLSEDPARLFLEGRLSAPTGYANATAALWLIAFWPALGLASGADLRWPLRGLGLASAALLLEMALLSQSRGAAIAFAVTALVFVAMTPRRITALLGLTFVCLVAALAWEPLVAVHGAGTRSDIGPALAGARWAIVASVGAAFLAGAAAALIEGRLAFAPRRGLIRAGRWGLVALIVASAVSGAVATGSPWASADDRWQDFKTSGYEEVDAEGSRFSGSLGSNRYDFYRVALNEFRAHPVAGIGADNFAVPYLSQRRSTEAPRYPHSLAMRLIAQLGAVGTVLFLLFLGLTLACVWRTSRRCTAAEAGLAASAAAGFTFWLVHGMADWLWEFAGLGVIAFALLALAARLAPPAGVRPAADGSPGRAGRAGRAARAGMPRLVLAVTAVLATVSLSLPGSAARVERAAFERAAADPDGALAGFDLAADLNFLSGEALAAHGVLARREGMTRIARKSLRRALEREPASWYVRFQLALLEADSGHPKTARAHAEAAAALNPRQPVLHTIRRRLVRGAEVDGPALERSLYEQRQVKLRPVQGEGG